MARFWSVLLAMIILASPPALGRDQDYLSDPLPRAEDTLFHQLNEERIKAGRDPLIRDSSLTQLARQKAVDMAVNSYFDHVSPTLGTVYDMLESQRISYKWAGENIARTSSVDVVHDAFMASPDHRANIISAGYTHVGIGAVTYRGKVYVAQIFMRPRS